MPFYLSSTDVLQADGSDDEKLYAADAQARFLEDLGLLSEHQRAQRIQRARNVHDESIALARAIAAASPVSPTTVDR
jgi:hypothetical protein